MNVALMLALLTLLILIVGIVGAALINASAFGGAAKTFLIVILALHVFVAVSNVLEHSGATGALDPYEGYALLLFFPFSLFFIYAMWTNLEHARRVTAELSVTEREREFTRIISYLPGFVYRCRNDRKWTMEFVSDGVRKLTGYGPEDLVDNRVISFRDLIVPEDRDLVWSQVQEAVAARQPFSVRYRIETAAGERRWIWEQGVGVLSRDGRLLTLEGFVADVTDVEVAQESLRRSQQRLLEAQRIARLGSWEWHADSGRLLWSEEACALFGLVQADAPLDYERFLQIVHPEDRQEVRAAFDSVLQGADTIDVECRIAPRRDGEHYVHERGKAFRGADGLLIRVVGTLQDITERKRAELELDTYRRHLESLVRRRTDQLNAAQAQLRLSLRELEADEEAGRIVQFKLLPAARCALGRYEFSRHLVPSMYLSGDFMDFFEIGGDRVGFYIADVSGHGASSAFITVFFRCLIRNYLENYISRGDPAILDPSAILRGLNAELLRQGLDKHVTMFYGVLEPDGNRLTFANAGHFPFPMLWRNGAHETLFSKALPLGLFDFAAYDNNVMSLPDDFVLFLFSDGILEALPGETLPLKLAALTEKLEQDAFDADRLVSDLGLARAEHFRDDVAFLMARRCRDDVRQDTVSVQ